MEVEKYIKDGKVAILYSPGFGAGWSTWGKPEFAYDKRIVEFWLEHKDDIEYLNKLDNHNSKECHKAETTFMGWGYDHVYFGGFKQIQIAWLPVGTLYHIDEYDGAESLQTVSNMPWSVA